MIIGAVLIPGAAAPKLISRAQLAELKPGAALVDVAIDQGGCFETSRATTHQDHPMHAPLPADSDRLTQVIGNLTSNSLRFARSAVWIRTRSLPRDGVAGVAIDVADDGPGIDAADLPHVFERLYQAQNQVDVRESGSGLGLAIVKELVEGMGGTVAVASVAGTGTTFTVWLPTVATS